MKATNLIPKIEELVRIGLIPVQKLAFLKRAMSQMEKGNYMPSQERSVFYHFLERILEIVLQNPAIFRQLRTQIAMKREEANITEVIKPEIRRPLSAHSPEVQKKVAADLAKHRAHIEALKISAKKEYEAANAERLGAKQILKKLYKRSKKDISEETKKDESKKKKYTRRDREERDRADYEAEISRRKNEEVEYITEISLRKSDHDVLKAFSEKRKMESRRLQTDGKHLHGNWMGGSKIAHWDGDKVRLNDIGSRFGQTIHDALRRRHVAKNDIHETTLIEDVNFREAPDTMLQSLANVIHRKRRAGGRPTPEDKKLATRAKNELRRRRGEKKYQTESTLSYESKLQAGLKHFGLGTLSDLQEEQRVDFFQFVENYKGE